jgi:hypothetical protein
MRHPFGNDASHIKLWGASFPNYPVWIAWEWQPLYAYLVSDSCTFRSWFRQHNPVALLHMNIKRVIEEQQGYAVKIMNGRYRSQNQRARNDRHSWVGLGPIYPNRVYLCHLLFMTMCICLFSIKNGRRQKGDVRQILLEKWTLGRMGSNCQGILEPSFCWLPSCCKVPLHNLSKL